MMSLYPTGRWDKALALGRFFGFPIEEKIAAKLKCPLHGDRFMQFLRLYVPPWRRENERKRWRNIVSSSVMHGSPAFQMNCGRPSKKLWMAD